MKISKSKLKQIIKEELEKVLYEEEAALGGIAGWFVTKNVAKIYKEAEAKAKKFYTGARKDAFRHLYGMARLTLEYNRFVATFYGYGNELKGATRAWRKGMLHSEYFKDTKNNALGIRWALENPKLGERLPKNDRKLIRFIKKKIKDGEFYTRPNPDKDEMLYKHSKR